MSLRLLGACLLGLALVSATLVGAANARESVYVVQKGDSLWGIAKRYGVTVASVKAENKLGKSDQIEPGQRLIIPEKGAAPRRRKEPASDRYVARRPSHDTQVQKSSQERGVNPCNTKDPGFVNYEPWSHDIRMGQMLVPKRGALSKSGHFDVLFHFHGHEPVRKEWVQVMRTTVLVGIDLGTGSGPYEATFRGTGAFKQLVGSVERALTKRLGRLATARRIGLSGWSAGYGAVGQILASDYGKRRVDSAILLDGLHSGYQGKSLNELQLEPFVDFSRRASRGERFMFVSHSSIIPPGYASTTETANYLIHRLRGHPRRARPRPGDPMGLDLVSTYTRQNFHVRGYAGNSTLDHCAHIGLLRDVLKVHVKPRWHKT